MEHITFWNKEGDIIGQLSDSEEGILVYDTINETAIKLITKTTAKNV